jgi:hypothetical protein
MAYRNVCQAGASVSTIHEAYFRSDHLFSAGIPVPHMYSCAFAHGRRVHESCQTFQLHNVYVIFICDAFEFLGRNGPFPFVQQVAQRR